MVEQFRNKLYSTLNGVLPLICEELEMMKKSYFNEIGKPSWNPLKEQTIKKKLKYVPENANKFNVYFGNLRDSIKISYALNQNEISIIVEANHEKGDVVIKRLINDYGRDFFHFDENEIKFIVKRLRDKIAESFRQ